METSPEIPNSEQANGISKREPPAIPEVPQAASVDRMHKTNAEGASHAIPSRPLKKSVFANFGPYLVCFLYIFRHKQH